MGSPEIFTFWVNRMQRVKPYHAGQMLPKPRSGHRCIANDSNLYTFGGYNPHVPVDDPDLRDDPHWPESRPLFRELWKFNFATRCWTKLKTVGFVPKELASHSALLHDNCLLVFGGTAAPFGSSSSNKLHCCHLQMLQWQEIETTGELPLEQYGQAVSLENNKLYVVGGTTGFEYSIDVHCLDLNERSWKYLSEKRKWEDGKRPSERYRHEIAFHKNKIYVFGGGTALISFDFHQLPCFDVNTKLWSTVPTIPDTKLRNRVPRNIYPAARRCHSLVRLNDDIFICGGYTGSNILSDIWKVNLNSLQWKRIVVRVPQATYFHSAAVTPSGCMYVHGGVTNILQNVRTAQVYRIWLKIPKLKEMCWQAMLHYCPNLPHDYSQSSLLEMGIPREFVDQIEIPAEYG